MCFGSSSYFSIGDSELIIHFQEAYARLFPNCYNKQGIQTNLPSYRPMNLGTICAKVYPQSTQPIKGNNCGLIPYISRTCKQSLVLDTWKIVINRLFIHVFSTARDYSFLRDGICIFAKNGISLQVFLFFQRLSSYT